MSFKFLKLSLFLFFFSSFAFSQLGGTYTFGFLNLSAPARTAAMGGDVISIADKDVNLAYQNPALLNGEMHNHLAFTTVNYFADINFGYVSYARNINDKYNGAVSLHHINYGDFDRTDPFGNVIGKFKASEYSIAASASRMIDSSFTIGATVKTIVSEFDEYNSFGLAADIGVFYEIKRKDISMAFVVKNAGAQLTTFTDGDNEPLPIDVQFAITKKLDKAPFRFTLLLHDLQKFDITNQDPDLEDEIDPLTGERIDNSISFGEKLFYHVNVSGELLLSDNFHVRAGYNQQRRKDLGLDNRMSTVGLSWGFGFRISKFHLSYGRATYHLAGASNHFSVTTDLDSWYKKKFN